MEEKKDSGGILPKVRTNPIPLGESDVESNDMIQENENTTTISSGDSSFEEGDEDYDDEQEANKKKKEVKDSYVDYNGNSEANNPNR